MAVKGKDIRPIAVLGLGRFGQRLARQLAEGGEDVLACDKDRNTIEHIASHVTQAIALDVTDEAAMRDRGVHKAKAGVVAIGEDFEAAVLTTVILRHMNIPRIIARARSRTMGEVLRRVGAHEVVLAEDEAADRWASRLLGPRVLNQIDFHDGYSIVEFEAPKVWIGRALAEIGVRRTLNLHVVAVKRSDSEASAGFRIAMLPPDQPLTDGDVLIIMGKDEDIKRLSAIDRGA